MALTVTRRALVHHRAAAGHAVRDHQRLATQLVRDQFVPGEDALRVGARFAVEEDAEHHVARIEEALRSAVHGLRID